MEFKNVLSKYSERFNSFYREYVDFFSLPEILRPSYETSVYGVKFNLNHSVAGFNLTELRNTEGLLDLLPGQDLSYFLRLGGAIMSFRNDKRNIVKEPCKFRMDLVFRMKGKHGKIHFVKRKTFDNGVDRNGVVTHTCSYLEDVSYLKPSQLYSYDFTGKNAEYFDFQIPEIRKYQGILSKRETEILRLLARGFYSNDIAQSLKISRHTVDTHRRNMLRKLEVANTPELLLMAKDMGLY